MFSELCHIIYKRNLLLLYVILKIQLTQYYNYLKTKKL